jgi:hypothetical protein
VIDPGAAQDGGEGRQHERTALAWLRTALATVAVALFMVRQAEPGTERWLVGAAAGGALVAILATLRERSARLATRPTVVGPARRANAVMLGSLLLLDAVGLFLAW